MQSLLGAKNAFAFDVNAVCSGVMYALNVATNFISSGQVKTALVIGADTFSTFVDFKRRDACFFGDGAGAILLSASDTLGGFSDFALSSDPIGYDKFRISYGLKTIKGLSDERFFEMDGQDVYKTAMQILPTFLEKFLEKNDCKFDDIDLIVSHQPSFRLLTDLLDKISFDKEKAIFNFEENANTGSATVAMACAEAIKKGSLKKAKKTLFFSIGAGWTWGAALYEKG